MIPFQVMEGIARQPLTRGQTASHKSAPRLRATLDTPISAHLDREATVASPLVSVLFTIAQRQRRQRRRAENSSAADSLCDK